VLNKFIVTFFSFLDLSYLNLKDRVTHEKGSFPTNYPDEQRGGYMNKDKKMIKRDILDKFRDITADEDYVLPQQWLESDYFKTLRAEEKKLFKKAVDELISKGLVENVKGTGLNLKLTQKGADLIYQRSI